MIRPKEPRQTIKQKKLWKRFPQKLKKFRKKIGDKTKEVQEEASAKVKELQKKINGMKGFKKHIFTTNLGLNTTVIEKFESPGSGLMLGGKYSFYLNPKVGLFVGLDYIQRNASEKNFTGNHGD